MSHKIKQKTYKIKRKIMRFTSEILTISVELAEYHFGILALMQIDRSISCEDMRENDFYIFVSSNLEL